MFFFSQDWSSSDSEDEDDETAMQSAAMASSVVSMSSPTKSLLNEAYLAQTQLDVMIQPSYWAKAKVDIDSSHPIASLPCNRYRVDIYFFY